MIRFLLSIIIFTLLVTYAIIPVAKYIKKFFRNESKRIDKAFNDEENNEKENDK